MQHTEICILGAGPGGACAALDLARQNIPCVLIDKAEFPRDKVGGDVMPGIILRALHEIDPDLVPKFAGHPRLMEIKGTELFAPNGRKITVNYRNISIGEFKNTVSCFSAPRKVFDELLIQEVRASSRIRLIEGQAVHRVIRQKDGLLLLDRSGNFGIHTQLLIVANGANDFIGRQLTGSRAQPQHLGIGLRAYFRNVDFGESAQYAQLFFTEDILPGIFYMTPLPEGLTNINLGTRQDVLKKKKLDLKAILNQIIREHPKISPRFSKASPEGQPMGWTLPFITQKRKLSGDRYLLVGDSGSLIDFVSGNGIGSAMYSGIFAARKAAAGLEQQDFSEGFLQDYETAVYQKLKTNLKIGRLLAPFFGLYRMNGLYKMLINQFFRFAADSDLITELIYQSDIEKKVRSKAFYQNLLKSKSKSR